MELWRRRCNGVMEEKVYWSYGGEGVMELWRRRCNGVMEEKVIISRLPISVHLRQSGLQGGHM